MCLQLVKMKIAVVVTVFLAAFVEHSFGQGNKSTLIKNYHSFFLNIFVKSEIKIDGCSTNFFTVAHPRKILKVFINIYANMVSAHKVYGVFPINWRAFTRFFSLIHLYM